MYGTLQGKVSQYADRVCLEVRVDFLVSTWKGSAACSRRVYCVSTSYRDLLTKNTGLCFRFSSSLNKAALIETSKTAK